MYIAAGNNVIANTKIIGIIKLLNGKRKDDKSILDIKNADRIYIPGKAGKAILPNNGIGSYCVKLVDPNQKKPKVIGLSYSGGSKSNIK